MKLTMQQARDHAVTLASFSPMPDPNPRVGCVIVSETGDLLAEGYHRGAGTAHAEAAAINEAIAYGRSLRGATAYVTLEPCAHQGRTASCAHALVRAGVAKVVYGQADPNVVASGGARVLREAGITVEQDDELAAGSLGLNSDWTFSMTHGRPRVTWKYAATLDGRSAAADGTSQWITGEGARADVHRLRAKRGAILVGTGTALADDPSLTVRGVAAASLTRQPLRVVAGHREVPADARLRDGEAPTLFVDSHDPAAILATIAERGVHSVWLEGGPVLAAAFVKAGLVDDIVAYIAPTLLGAGKSAVADLGIDTISAALRLDVVDVELVRSEGATPQTDVRLVLKPATKED